MNSSRCIFFLLFGLQFAPYSFSQVVSMQPVEDTLNSSISSINATFIGSCGDAVYQNDRNAKTSTVDLERSECLESLKK